ncbi:zinc finger protein with KRAB and SCAN domains 4 [Rattus norvegicus]|nr:zinc finger protein with KRAB and SCAN domains 4 [Rattus norvegicus]
MFCEFRVECRSIGDTSEALLLGVPEHEGREEADLNSHLARIFCRSSLQLA